MDNQPLTTIMAADPVTVDRGQTVSEVRFLLANERIHHLPVIEEGRLVGMISSNDVMRVSFSLDTDDAVSRTLLDQTVSIDDLMVADLVTVSAHGSVRDAAIALSAGGFHAVPVVDDEGHLVGIVTSTDLIQYLLDQH